MPIIFFDRIKSSVGVNCFPKGERSLEVNGVNLERSVMTRSIKSDITNLTSGFYAEIPFSFEISSGSRLIAADNGGIQIGSDISKVLISARLSLESGETAGKRYLKIVKNDDYNENNTIALSCDHIGEDQIKEIAVTPILVDVQENDIIYAMYCVPAESDRICGSAFGTRTSLTVETVE